MVLRFLYVQRGLKLFQSSKTRFFNLMYARIMLMIGKGLIEKLQPKKNEFKNT